MRAYVVLGLFFLSFSIVFAASARECSRPRTYLQKNEYYFKDGGQERKLVSEICRGFQSKTEVLTYRLEGFSSVNRGRPTELKDGITFDRESGQIVKIQLTDGRVLKIHESQEFPELGFDNWSGKFFYDALVIIGEEFFPMRKKSGRKKGPLDFPCPEMSAGKKFTHQNFDQSLVTSVYLCQSLFSRGGTRINIVEYTVTDKKRGTFSRRGNRDLEYHFTHHNDHDEIWIKERSGNLEYRFVFTDLQQTNTLPQNLMFIIENGVTQKILMGIEIPQDKQQDYVFFFDNLAQLDKFSRQVVIPGFGSTKSIKFLHYQRKIYYQNTKKHPFHYGFARDALELNLSPKEFEEKAYGNSRFREMTAATLLYYANAIDPLTKKKGLHVLEYFPSDTIDYTSRFIATYQALANTLPMGTKLFFKPSSQQQVEGYLQEKERLQALGVNIIFNEDLFNNLEYLALNDGEAYGHLRYIPATQKDALETLTFKDIALFERLPLDLGVVGGIITEEYQTPLSHVNLKSQARKTPNLVFPGAHTKRSIRSLINQLVHFTVKNGKYKIERARLRDAEKFWQNNRPKYTGQLGRNLTVKKIQSIANYSAQDAEKIGAKAANYAELFRILPKNAINLGMAIPFYFYDQFLKQNGLDKKIENLLREKKFNYDRHYQIQKLDELRDDYKKGIVDGTLLLELKRYLSLHFGPLKLRFRSSTNAEDLKGFNGAGLYKSTSYTPGNPRKTLERALKKVWGSVWTLKAFDERELYAIDHRKVYMGILVHPAFPDEEANGVAISRNIFNPLEDAFYINTQKGETSVTNPEDGSISEQLLSYFSFNERGKISFTNSYLRYSSLNNSRPVLAARQRQQLLMYLDRIHQHFKKIKDPRFRDPLFSMDIEFKLDDDYPTKQGMKKGPLRIVIKQARPY